jgi:hypothetical protein
VVKEDLSDIFKMWEINRSHGWPMATKN